MNRQERRAFRKAHKGKHGLACGCSGMVRLSTVLLCPDCSEEIPVDVWMPSSGLVGDTRDVGTWCPACDSSVEGLALIVDRVDA